MEKKDLRHPTIIAKENPAKAKADTLKKWRRVKAALEAIYNRAELRCGFCFLYCLYRDCNNCGLYHSGACGYYIKGKKVKKETDFSRFLAAMQEAIKWAAEIENKIADEISVGCIIQERVASIIMEKKKEDAREMLQEMQRERGE
jgi:hypothetical protein